MKNISQLGTSLAQRIQTNANRAISNIGSVTAYKKSQGLADIQICAQTQVSSLSRLLSHAAGRATARDASTSRDDLAAIRRFTVKQLQGDSYWSNKSAHDQEIPVSNDPRRLALARHATDFTNGKAENPFKGMSPDQLALIVYDDGDAFTVNERRSAQKEADRQYEEGCRAYCRKLMNEYSRTRKVSAKTEMGTLHHYKSLPAIEGTQFLQGYETRLLAQIQQARRDDTPQHKHKLAPLLELTSMRLRTGG